MNGDRLNPGNVYGNSIQYSQDLPLGQILGAPMVQESCPFQRGCLSRLWLFSDHPWGCRMTLQKAGRHHCAWRCLLRTLDKACSIFLYLNALNQKIQDKPMLQAAWLVNTSQQGMLPESGDKDATCRVCMRAGCVGDKQWPGVRFCLLHTRGSKRACKAVLCLALA